MLGNGLDRVPVRVPEKWSAGWFTKFIREFLALADTRNINIGDGLTIERNSNDVATLALEDDFADLRTASYILSSPSPNLEEAKVLVGTEGLTEVIVTEDEVRVTLGWDIPITRLNFEDDSVAFSVLGAPYDEPSLTPIVANADDTILRRVPNADPAPSVVDFGQLTVGMAPDSLWTYAKIQDGAALSVLGVAADSAGELNDIEAAANDTVLARTGDALSFTSLTVGMAADGLWTNAKLADMNAGTIKGRVTGTDAPQDLNRAQVRQILETSDSSVVINSTTMLSINLDLYSYKKIELDTGADLELSFSGASGGQVASIVLKCINWGAETWDIPGALYENGIKPTLSSTGTDYLSVIKDGDGDIVVSVGAYDVQTP